MSASLAAFSVAAAVAYAWAAPAAETPIPQLGGRELSWIVNFWDFQLDPPPGSGHGPMKTDPAYPYVSQIQNGGQVRAATAVSDSDRRHEGSDPEALGRQTDAGHERRAAERHAQASLPSRNRAAVPAAFRASCCSSSRSISSRRRQGGLHAVAAQHLRAPHRI